MKTYISLFSVLAFALFSCSDNSSNDKDTPHEAHENHQNKHKEHGHGKHNKANHYMNASDFEKLTQRFESPDRDTWQKPDAVLEKLGDLTGKKIADIGAGTGYFGFRLADAGATVISVDVDQRFIDYVENRKEERGTENLTTRLAEYDDPKLKDAEVDIIITVDTYHHFDDKIAYLKKCLAGIKPGGKMVIVDFKKKDTPHGPPADHRVSGKRIVQDLKDAGFDSVEMDSATLPEQNIIIATK